MDDALARCKALGLPGMRPRLAPGELEQGTFKLLEEARNSLNMWMRHGVTTLEDGDELMISPSVLASYLF